MQTPAFIPQISADTFLRAEPLVLRDWIISQPSRAVWFCITAILVGAGLYGASMGIWRSPLQGLFTGIKLPLAILLTTLGNGLLNGMLAPLLGFNIRFRESLAMILITFASASLLLGALMPVALFAVCNTPALSASTHITSPEYGIMQLTLTFFIALAGTVGNLAAYPLLRQWSGSPRVARNVLLAWLSCNLFLGSQICWILRPFIWDPSRPVEFVGPEFLSGSFYETVFDALCRLMNFT